MKSREPVLVHGRDYWDEINLPASVFEQRVAALREEMAAEGVDALLVYGRGDRDGHLCYVSNLVNKVPNWGLLVGITPDSVVVRNERSSRTRPVVERGTWIEDIEFCDSVVEDIDGLVGESAATIATAGFGRLPVDARRRFARETEDREVVSFDDALAAHRIEKSRHERDQIARAGRLLIDVHDTLPSGASGTVEETALAGEADRRARLRGARDVRFLVGNPTRTEPHLRPAEERPVAGGDPLVCYTAARYEGYWAERARTLRLDGERPYGDAYDEAVSAYADFLDSFRAGRTTAEVAAAARELVADTDWRLVPEYDLGHGIGLETDEAPAVTEGPTDTELRAGMTLSARLALAPESDDGLVVLNDTLAVTGGAPEVLTGDWS